VLEIKSHVRQTAKKSYKINKIQRLVYFQFKATLFSISLATKMFYDFGSVAPSESKNAENKKAP